MNKKTSILVIFLIFAIPILLYFIIKNPHDNSAISMADTKGVNKPRVLHFSQAMCSECRRLETVMKPVEEEYSGKIKFVDIDVSEGNRQTQELVSKYNVRVVPTLVFMDKNGKTVDRTEGSMTKETLEGYLNKLCN